jgi:hypothetical protein
MPRPPSDKMLHRTREEKQALQQLARERAKALGPTLGIRRRRRGFSTPPASSVPSKPGQGSTRG